MDALPVEVYSAASVRAMDRHAIERAGIPGYTLMQRAGDAALDAVMRHWPAAARIAVLCGAGNNAGDGYVLARRARAAGITLSVAALGDPGRLSGDAAEAWRDFAADGGSAGTFDASAVDGADLVVDALLGSGVDRPVDGALRDCIERVNRAGRPVLALDIPSGLDADSGLPRGVAVVASRTVGFVALKCGYFLGAAPDHVGSLELADLGLPADIRESGTPVLRRMTGPL